MPATFAAGIRKTIATTRRLEQKLQAQLHVAWVARVVDLTIRPGGNVRARERGEVRMVEDIENFPSELERLGFGEANTL